MGCAGCWVTCTRPGAAIDFSVLYPTGRLVDATLPAWSHRRLLLNDTTDRLAHGSSVAVHPLLGPHVRLAEEPERHVWQGEVGTDALPWLADHQIHGAAALPGAAYCEMALTAARTVLGEASEVRDVRFEQLLLLDEQTSIGASATVEASGLVTFAVETDEEGARSRRASAVLQGSPRMTSHRRRMTSPPCWPRTPTQWKVTSFGRPSTCEVFSTAVPSPA